MIPSYQIISMVLEEQSRQVILSHMSHISILRYFGESFILVLSKIFDTMWHTALFSKLPSFYLFSSILHYLTNRTFSIMVDESDSPQAINRGVPLDFVLSLTVFLIFIVEFLIISFNLTHSYSDDLTPLHYFLMMIWKKKIANWGKGNLVNFKDSKTQFQWWPT